MFYLKPRLCHYYGYFISKCTHGSQSHTFSYSGIHSHLNCQGTSYKTSQVLEGILGAFPPALPRERTLQRKRGKVSLQG